MYRKKQNSPGPAENISVSPGEFVMKFLLYAVSRRALFSADATSSSTRRSHREQSFNSS